MESKKLDNAMVLDPLDTKRATECAKEVKKLLDDSNCEIDASFTISKRGIDPRIAILPLPEKKDVEVIEVDKKKDK